MQASKAGGRIDLCVSVCLSAHSLPTTVQTFVMSLSLIPGIIFLRLGYRGFSCTFANGADIMTLWYRIPRDIGIR